MDMHRLGKKIGVVIATIAVGAVAAVIPHLVGGGPVRERAPVTVGPAVGMPGAPPTSSSGLSQRVSEMEARLRAQPGDVAAAVLLADALLRQARAANDVRASGRAGEVLKGVLNEDPGQYEALRLLGAIDLSQHRFRDALDVAKRARDLRPDDAWNYGVMGDAQIELGDYEQAYDAFDRMMALRPSAAAYARVAYARELRGDVTGALQAMQMAAQATAPQDPEAQAWYAAQTGELNLKLGRIAGRRPRLPVRDVRVSPLSAGDDRSGKGQGSTRRFRWGADRLSRPAHAHTNARPGRACWRYSMRAAAMPCRPSGTIRWLKTLLGQASCKPRRTWRSFWPTTTASYRTL